MSPFQAPASSSPQPPLLNAEALSFFMHTAGLLSGPVGDSEFDHCCQRFCEFFNANKIVCGLLNEPQGLLQPRLNYQRRKLSLSTKTEVQKISGKNSNLILKPRGWINPSDQPSLFQLIKQNHNNHQQPFYFVSQSVEGEGQSIQHWILALNSTKPVSDVETFEFLLDECGQLLLTALANHLQDLKCAEESEQLSAAINISDSIYATWHEKAGWQYHNINGFLKLGYDSKKFDISWLQQNNPMHPEDWQWSLKKFRNLVKNGIGYDHDFRAICPNGEILWYHASTKLAEKNQHGGTRMLTSVSRDINALKAAEQKAVEALHREQWLVEQTHKIYQSQDFNGFVPTLEALGHYLNLSRCSIRIVDPETHLVNLVAEWHTPELTALASLFPEMTSQVGMGWMQGFIQHGEANVINDIKTEETSKKIRNYHLEIGSQAVISQPMIAGDKLIGYLAILSSCPRQWTEDEIHLTKVIADTIHTTITRNRLLAELRAAEERIQLAMINSTYSLWDHKPQQDSLYLSPHFYTALGYQAEECDRSPRQLLNLIHPDERQKILDLPNNQYRSESGEIKLELRLRRKDGSYSWLLCRGKVIERDHHNRPLHVMGINLDINQLKETAEELRIARERAEASNQSKSEFLERMSHEIRTPMNAILGMSYLALDSDFSREQRTSLEDIEAAAKSLLHVIDDILDFSKIESGELSFVEEKFDLHQAVNKILKLFAVRARESNNKLRATIADDIPQFVIGDANRVGQVITNLVSNAIKFTRDGEVDISLQLAEHNNKNDSVSILFSVKDTGIGLPQSQLKNIFQPFTQADGATTRKYGGTGLGLSICKHLVEMMGGSIHAFSLPNAGTTFHFTVVFKQVYDAGNHRRPANQPTLRKSSFDVPEYFQNKKVLLTEDNIVNQRVAIGILKKFNLEVVTANNGQDALALLEAAEPNQFDAILMDIEMPVLDGLETTKQVRQLDHYRNIPIIAMTAHAMLGDKERCIEVGMDEYIPKPVNPQALLSVLRTIWLPGDKGLGESPRND